MPNSKFQIKNLCNNNIEQQTTNNEQRTTNQRQLSTINHQPSTVNHQPFPRTTNNEQPSTIISLHIKKDFTYKLKKLT
ncbi:MAG TPA: hypothetical protein DDY04_08000 [Bacteroidales bacterium]|nr:hypothetical protein [Bacteroidales bacterium]